VKEAGSFIQISRYLSRRLLPVTLGIGITISVVTPATYYILEYKALEQAAIFYANDVVDKFQGFVLEEPTFWKYRTYKYSQFLRDVVPKKDEMRIIIRDEAGKPVVTTLPENDIDRGWLPRHDPVATLPIKFNNKMVGSVQVQASQKGLITRSAVIAFVSTIVGTTLAAIVFFFPVKVAVRMEGELRRLFDSLDAARIESDSMRRLAEASEQRFRELVQGLNAIVWEARAETLNFIFVSKEAEQLPGYPVQNWLSEPDFWSRLLPPEEVARVAEFYAYAVKNGEARVEYKAFTKDGEIRWLRNMARMVADSTGQSGTLRGVMVDITDLKLAEEALVEHAQELARSNAELEQFAYAASHDLQEPLRMVASYVQLLARRYQGKLDAEADEYIAFAVEGATRMQDLIRDILGFSRIGNHAKPPEVDANAVLKKVLKNMEPAVNECGATITCDRLPTVRVVENQLGLLFANLIGNSIKFRGSSPPLIHIEAQREGGYWRFCVRDNGIGIATEHVDRIFRLFQRLNPRKQYPGTGIGLAICKKIVELCGGRIWVESVPKQGASFYFTIPDRQVTANEQS